MSSHYRPEIDGLRAIAVLSVIFYHAQLMLPDISLINGGFIGVDVFFVISGYLISSILFNELNNNQTINLTRFYERRIRRILPNLLLVICTTVPVSWYLLYPSQFMEYAGSILSSLGFVSNIYFYYTGLDYYASDAIFKPLLHTWSLSVEEQFYIVFPILILLCYRHVKQYLFHIIVLLMALSLALAHWRSGIEPSESFYLLHTRFWELMMGSACAWFMLNGGGRYLNRIPSLLAMLLGIAMIVLSFIYFDVTTLHPSLLTLFPVIGTCLIILFGGHNDLIDKLLSSRLLVCCGLISYSLYLWHYPVFAFAEVAGFEGTLRNSAALVLATFALSIASYFIIEKPARDTNKITYKKLLLIISFVFCGLIAFAVYAIAQDGLKERFEEHILLYKNNEFDNNLLAIESWKHLKPEEPSFYDDDKTNVLFIGDSHSKDMFNVFFLNRDLFPEYRFSRMGNEWNDGYIIRMHPMEKLREYPNYDLAEIVVLSTNYFKKEVRQLPALIRFLKEDGKTVVITSKTTIFDQNKKRKMTVFDLLLEQIVEKNKPPADFQLTLGQYLYGSRLPRTYAEINSQLKKISEDENVMYLEKDLFQCDHEGKICDGVTNEGYKIYYDGAHYTLEGAKYFGQKIHDNKLFAFD